MNDNADKQDLVETVPDDAEELSTEVTLRPRDLPQRPSNPLIAYIVVPLIFLSVTGLGGFRLSGADNAFLFLKPPLVCLVLAAILTVLFLRSGLVLLDGWFSPAFSLLQNAAGATVLLTVFTASVQMFNAVLPEQGLPFWVVGFCFFWTLWTDLFADLKPDKLVRSLCALFGLAFAVKYLLLANLTAPATDGWLQAVLQNPTKEAFTWLLDLPRYAPGTGYVQFITVALYLSGLFLTPRGIK
jgi:hypothetical protein